MSQVDLYSIELWEKHLTSKGTKKHNINTILYPLSMK